jgi:hypothetical protein
VVLMLGDWDTGPFRYASPLRRLEQDDTATGRILWLVSQPQRTFATEDGSRPRPHAGWRLASTSGVMHGEWHLNSWTGHGYHG